MLAPESGTVRAAVALRRFLAPGHGRPMRRARASGNPFRVERITGAANGADDVRLAERQAQAADMDVNGPQFDVLAVRPNGLEQLLAREDASRIFQEMAQQPIFGGAELNALAVAANPVGGEVHLDRAIVERLRGECRSHAAQDGTCARNQLL